MHGNYWRFAAMIATSTLVMFGLMYVHTYAWHHAYFSETRAWMALLMGAVMAIVMLGFMLGMYTSRAVNAAIFAGATIVSAAAVWLVRSQVTVTGLDYMEAMVPHHSIALLTSKRARIDDPRVRKLADEVIESQRKEIAEMRFLIRALERDSRPSTTGPGAREMSAGEEIPAGEAARRAELATTDLESMTDTELRRMLGTGPVCRFGYAPEHAPVAVARVSGAGADGGVIKLHGRLVRMDVRYQGTPEAGFELSSDDVSVVVRPYEGTGSRDSLEGEARLRVGRALDVGYAGFYGCTQ